MIAAKIASLFSRRGRLKGLPEDEPRRNAQRAGERDEQGVDVVAVADGANESVFGAPLPGLLGRIICHRSRDVIVEVPRLPQGVRLATDDIACQGAGLVVDIDEALFTEE